MLEGLTDYDIIKVLIHWLTNRTIAKMSEKTFYNDVEALAGDIYQQIGLLHTTYICKSFVFLSRDQMNS